MNVHENHIPPEVSPWNQIEINRQAHLRMLLQEEHYDQVLSHINRHPEDVNSFSHQNYTCLPMDLKENTFLHNVVQANVPREYAIMLVQTVLSIVPTLAGRLNTDNVTPLELALSRRDRLGQDMAMIMIQEFKEGVEMWIHPFRNCEQPTPPVLLQNHFHIACSIGTTIDVLRAMLFKCPELSCSLSGNMTDYKYDTRDLEDSGSASKKLGLSSFARLFGGDMFATQAASGCCVLLVVASRTE